VLVDRREPGRAGFFNETCPAASRSRRRKARHLVRSCTRRARIARPRVRPATPSSASPVSVVRLHRRRRLARSRGRRRDRALRRLVPRRALRRRPPRHLHPVPLRRRRPPVAQRQVPRGRGRRRSPSRRGTRRPRASPSKIAAASPAIPSAAPAWPRPRRRGATPNAAQIFSRVARRSPRFGASARRRPASRRPLMFRGRVRHVHFVGVGGVGMSGLAEILRSLEFDVSGSDMKESSDHAPPGEPRRAHRRRPPPRERPRRRRRRLLQRDQARRTPSSPRPARSASPSSAAPRCSPS
jgi:hypothetical protein